MASTTRSIVRVLIPLAVLFAGVSGFQALKSLKKPPVRREAKKRIPNVRVLRVQPRTLSLDLEGYGTVRAKRQVSIAPQVSGRVVWVNDLFKVGRFIQEGNALVRIEADDYQNRATSAQALLGQAEAEVQRLNRLKVNLERELKNQNEMVALALDESKRSNKAYLNAPGAIPVNERDRARAAYLQSISAEIKLKNALDLIPAQLARAKAQLDQRVSELNQAKVDLKRTTITAPFNGQVVARAVEVGQYVTTFPLTGVGSIADTEAFEIPVMVEAEQMSNLAAVPVESLPPEAQATYLQGTLDGAGAVAEIRWLAHRGKFSWAGRLTRIEPLDPHTRMIPLVVEAQQPWKSMRPGEHPPLVLGAFCHVRIRGRELAKAYVIPERALRNGHQVHIVREGKLEIRTVSIRLRRKDEVVIDKGLNPGDVLIVSSLSYPTANMAVNVIEDEQTPESSAPPSKDLPVSRQSEEPTQGDLTLPPTRDQPQTATPNRLNATAKALP